VHLISQLSSQSLTVRMHLFGACAWSRETLRLDANPLAALLRRAGQDPSQRSRVVNGFAAERHGAAKHRRSVAISILPRLQGKRIECLSNHCTARVALCLQYRVVDGLSG
jgi:hypothetical protein